MRLERCQSLLPLSIFFCDKFCPFFFFFFLKDANAIHTLTSNVFDETQETSNTSSTTANLRYIYSQRDVVQFFYSAYDIVRAMLSAINIIHDVQSTMFNTMTRTN